MEKLWQNSDASNTKKQLDKVFCQKYGYLNGWIYMHKCKLNNEKLTQWKNCGKTEMIQTQKRLTG